MLIKIYTKTDKNNNDTNGDIYLNGKEIIHKYYPLRVISNKS